MKPKRKRKSATAPIAPPPIYTVVERAELIGMRNRAWSMSHAIQAEQRRVAAASPDRRVPSSYLCPSDLESIAWIRLAMDCNVLDAMLARRGDSDWRDGR